MNRLKILLVITVFCFSSLLGETKYHFVDLGLLSPGKNSFALDINDEGWVVGGYFSKIRPAATLDSVQSIIWLPSNEIYFINELSDRASCALSINNKNNIVGITGNFGWFYNSNSGTLYYTADTKFPYKINDNDVYCNNDYADINNNNQKISNPNNFATLNGHKIMLYESIATAINNNQQVTGWYRKTNFQGNPCLDLNYWGILYGPNRGISLILLAQGNIRAFLWQNNLFIDLGTLGGSSSQSTDVNDLGQVVGASLTGKTFKFPGTSINKHTVHAFLWENGEIKDLNELINKKPSNVEIVLATSINNNGQICGIAKVGAEEHAFRLDPM